MFAKVNSIGLFGLNAFGVEVETEVTKGQPAFDIVGLADTAVKESRERIRSAFRSCGTTFPNARVIVNLAPADTKKAGSVFDLGIFMSVMRSVGAAPHEIPDHTLDECVFIGEVSLSGDVRGVAGVLPMVLCAEKHGFKAAFVPADNAHEASVCDGIAVYGISSVTQLMDHLTGKNILKPQPRYIPEPGGYFGSADYADVKGQTLPKKALETAAAGGHNLLMIGPPGTGKSMLAKRIPSILPAMTFEESIETTNIHSVCGMVSKEEPLVVRRPFFSPHHTISGAGLCGGGSVPRPGQISLAHNGVLFLDELPEFARPTLEMLRQPLEDRQVTISRASGTVTYPCSFMLVAAMNPCPCGYMGHPTKKCICSPNQAKAYLSRISGPLLDRFDLHVEVAPVTFNELSSVKKEESSAAMRERVQAAREIQRERFRGTDITCNARITPEIFNEVCPMSEDAKQLLENVFNGMGLSARAYDRIVKVARTVADMDGSQVIEKPHISRAVHFRTLDRKYRLG
ncbi:MAG: YifB family Mg chelatase-like AAA ATPase [Oscillospiraceae bacterium]|nr:YifB family Mg chelatase-like AAA ATPase [Oscillospiraceae bacterium]